MRSKHLARAFVLLWASVALLSVSCSDVGSSESLPSTAPAARAHNPDGVAYPSDHHGVRARRGSVRGDRIANLAFSGVRLGAALGDARALPDVLSMADYYDPELRRHRALHVVAAAGWCSICRQLMSTLARQHEALRAQGVSVVVVLVNGDRQGQGPSLDDFVSWQQRHPLPLDLGVDASAAQLAAFGLDAVPFNLLIDPRSMEILHAGIGEPTLPDYPQQALRFVENNPPSYP